MKRQISKAQHLIWINTGASKRSTEHCDPIKQYNFSKAVKWGGAKAFGALELSKPYLPASTNWDTQLVTKRERFFSLKKKSNLCRDIRNLIFSASPGSLHVSINYSLARSRCTTLFCAKSISIQCRVECENNKAGVILVAFWLVEKDVFQRITVGACFAINFGYWAC